MKYFLGESEQFRGISQPAYDSLFTLSSESLLPLTMFYCSNPVSLAALE